MVDPIAPPRAVLSASVRLLYRVLGEDRLRTAKGNAWEAVCADRRRAVARAEVQRILAGARTGERRNYGSGPPAAGLRSAATREARALGPGTRASEGERQNYS